MRVQDCEIRNLQPATRESAIIVWLLWSDYWWVREKGRGIRSQESLYFIKTCPEYHSNPKAESQPPTFTAGMEARTALRCRQRLTADTNVIYWDKKPENAPDQKITNNIIKKLQKCFSKTEAEQNLIEYFLNNNHPQQTQNSQVTNQNSPSRREKRNQKTGQTVAGNKVLDKRLTQTIHTHEDNGKQLDKNQESGSTIREVLQKERMCEENKSYISK